MRFINRLGDTRRDGGGRRGSDAIQLGFGTGAKRRQHQSQSKTEKGIAKHQRLEFHIPPTLQI